MSSCASDKKFQNVKDGVELVETILEHAHVSIRYFIILSLPYQRGLSLDIKKKTFLLKYIFEYEFLLSQFF